MRSPRLMIPVVAAILFLTGCSASAGDPESSPTPSKTTTAPAKPLTADEVVAALPDDDQMPEGYSTWYRCPAEEDGCPPDYFGVTAALDDQPNSMMMMTFSLGATQYKSAAAAEADMEAARKRADAENGAYSIELETDEDGNTVSPGRTGERESDEATIGEWRGVSTVQTVKYTLAEEEDLGERREALIFVQNGNWMISCQAQARVDRAGDAMLQICQDAVADFLDRVDQGAEG